MKNILFSVFLYNPGVSHTVVSIHDIVMVVIALAGSLFAFNAVRGVFAARNARAEFAKNGDPAKHSFAMIMAQYYIKIGSIGLVGMVVSGIILEIIWRFMLAA